MGAERSRARLPAVAALLALFLQIFAVQTHIDGFPALGEARAELSHTEARAAVEAAMPTAEQPTACPICQALANGATPLAVGEHAAGPAFSAVLENAARVQAIAPAAPAHPWQSRAPPLPL